MGKKKIRVKNGAGFTLVELLITMLILLMVTAVVAGGVPVAVNAYYNVITSANGQVFLSTTMSRLREELDMAKIVEAKDGVVTYYSEKTGVKAKIFCEDNKGIYISWLPNEEDVEEPTSPTDSKNKFPLVTEWAASTEASNDRLNRNLYATYSDVDYKKEQGILIFKGLKVQKKQGNSNPVSVIDYGDAESDGFKIRVFNSNAALSG